MSAGLLCLGFATAWCGISADPPAYTLAATPCSQTENLLASPVARALQESTDKRYRQDRRERRPGFPSMTSSSTLAGVARCARRMSHGGLFQIRHVFIHWRCRADAPAAFCRMWFPSRSHRWRSTACAMCELARMLRHLGGQHAQERMRIRHFGPALERLGRLHVVLWLL